MLIQRMVSMKDDGNKYAPVNAFEASLQHREGSRSIGDKAVRTGGAVGIGEGAYGAQSQMQTHGLPSLHFLL